MGRDRGRRPLEERSERQNPNPSRALEVVPQDWPGLPARPGREVTGTGQEAGGADGGGQRGSGGQR